MNKKASELQIGDCIFDMHDAFSYGLRNIPVRIEGECKITDVIRIGGCFGNFHMTIANIIGHGMYTNKLLVVLEDPDLIEGTWVVKAGWSYDGGSFGLMKIEVKGVVK